MINKLNQLPMFKNIDLSPIKYTSKHFTSKSIIRLSGDISKSLGIILNGEAIIEHINSQGQLMTVASFKKGDTIGGNRMFADDNAFPMTISAKEDTTILFITKDVVLDLCQKDLNFLEHFLKDIANKSDILSRRIKSLKFVSIEEQVITFLSKQMRLNKSYTFEIKISKKEWAETMGIQRTSLSRTLQKMKKKGWLLYKNHHFELLNYDIFD